VPGAGEIPPFVLFVAIAAGLALLALMLRAELGMTRWPRR
jgi:hypothetical protein